MLGNSEPVSGGILLTSDLELRADAAYQRHMDTFTAVSVLYRLVTALPEDDTDDGEEDVRAAVVIVQTALRRYREETRRAWHDSYRRWADAAGLDIDDIINGENAVDVEVQ